MTSTEIDFTSKWDLGDLQVKAVDGDLYVNHITLYLWSPVFKAMLLTGDIKDKDKSVIELTEWKKDDLVQFFKILHPPREEVNECNVNLILPLADNFHIQQLKDQSESILVNQVNEDTCIENLALAQKYKLEELEEKCIQLACTVKLKQWETSEHWDNLNSNTKEKLYQRKILKLENWCAFNSLNEEKSSKKGDEHSSADGTDFSKEWDLGDLRIRTDNGSVLYVNHMTLCLWSPVFKAMLLTSDTKERKSVLELVNWNKDDLIQFFRVLHPPTIRTKLDESTVSAIIPLADFFQIHRIKDEGEAILVTSVTQENCIEKCVFAEKYQLDKLKEKCVAEACELSLKEFKDSIYWQDLTSSTRETILWKKSEEMEEYRRELEICRSKNIQCEKAVENVENLKVYAGKLVACSQKSCYGYTLSSIYQFRNRCSNDCNCVKEIASDIQKLTSNKCNMM